MGTIKDRVAIVGMGCTKFGELWDKGFEDLMIDASHEALEDAGLETKDIQAAWFGSLISGCTGSRLANALKFNYIPITRVENFCCGGLDAFRNACYSVAAGIYDIVLACGVEKTKERSISMFNQLITDPFETSKVGFELPPVNLFAHFATRYFYKYGLSYEEGKKMLAKIAIKNHHNGTLSPKAHLRREITEEQVLNAPIISWPLGLFDCCGLSDGGAAAVITTPEIAKTMRDDYVLVKGLSIANGAGQGLLCGDDSLLGGDIDAVHFPENVYAAKSAYAEAGIKDPRKEITHAEVHDCFTSTEFFLYEDLGFSPKGTAKQDVESGRFTLEGEQPVNSDGGLKCFGHPLSASGLRMMYELYKQFQGKAGPRQIKEPKLGLAHNLGGLSTYFNVGVVILGARD
jgi:acetyl-CoA C-acetyltransferase